MEEDSFNRQTRAIDTEVLGIFSEVVQERLRIDMVQHIDIVGHERMKRCCIQCERKIDEDLSEHLDRKYLVK